MSYGFSLTVAASPILSPSLPLLSLSPSLPLQPFTPSLPFPHPPIFSFLLSHIAPALIHLTPELQSLTSVLPVATFCPSSFLSPHSLTSINHLSFS